MNTLISRRKDRETNYAEYLVKKKKFKDILHRKHLEK
jgi:hypothetical protein